MELNRDVTAGQVQRHVDDIVGAPPIVRTYDRGPSAAARIDLPMAIDVKGGLDKATAVREATPGQPADGPYPASIGEVADEVVTWIQELETAGVARGLARAVRDRLSADDAGEVAE